MLDAAAVVLAQYPDEIMESVTHPVTGLPGRLKWPPNIAEIREACEIAMAPIRAQGEREKRFAETQAYVAQQERKRMTAEEMEVKYGKGYGLGHKLPLPDQHMKVARSATERFEVPSWDSIMDTGGKLIPCGRKA